MPELPEVETIKRQLEYLIPFTIDREYISAGARKNIMQGVVPSLQGATLSDLEREGKQLIWTLENQSVLRSGLGMTGTWLILPCHSELEREQQCQKSHLHLHWWDKTRQLAMAYDDPRRFGKLYYQTNDEWQVYRAMMGPDLLHQPLSGKDLQFLSQRFPNQLLKVILLDQRFFPGSGNYIANEICARAKLLPTRKLRDINHTQWDHIAKAIKVVINLAVAGGGVTFQGGYRDTSGSKGRGVSELLVFYQKICRQCEGTPVTKIVLAQRGTYFCSQCQK